MATHPATSLSRAGAKTRSKATPSDYVSPTATRGLLAQSVGYRQQRLAAADMLSTDEAAALVGTNRVTVNSWVHKSRAIGLTQVKRGLRIPAWQFEPRMWNCLPRIIAALGTPEGWAVLTFLETPHGALDGLTPREAIERGNEERVIEIAEREGT